MEEENIPPLTALDQIANGSNLLMIKALLPYLPSTATRSLAFYIKYMELQNTMSFFNTSPDMTICSVPERPASPAEMIADIRRFCNPAQRSMLDECISTLETLEMYQSIMQST